MPEEAKKQLEQLLVGLGATAELLGATRDMLIKSGGFTRDEAVGMCTEMLLAITLPGLSNGGD